MRGETAIAASLLVVALCAGCTSWSEYKANGCKVGPNYCRPNAPVAEHWIDANDQRISSAEPDLSHWWTTFNDPTLDELIQAAQTQNLSLREAGFRILQARANLAIQMGNLFPQTQQAFGAYSRNATSVLAANRAFLPQRFFNDVGLGLNMSWELDFWGRFRRAIEGASDILDASVYDYNDVLVTLLGDVGTTYVEIRTLQQQLVYTNANIKIQQESLDIAQARFSGGLTSELDVEQATSQLAQTEANVPVIEKQIRQANDRLCILLGIPTEDLVKCMEQKEIPKLAPDIVIGVPCDLLCRRPDVRRAEREAAAQCAQIGIAVTELYPAISVTGTVGFQAQRFTDLFKDRSFEAGVGPGFRWNVLNYGRLVNNVRLQDARFMELVTAYRNTVLRANSEVEDGITEFLQSQAQAKAMQRSVTAADKAVQLAITQYRAGLVDFNRVALLEQNLVQQQDLLAQAQGNIALGAVRTYRALGGGWDVDCGQGNYGSQMSGYNEFDYENAESLPPGTVIEAPRNGTPKPAMKPETTPNSKPLFDPPPLDKNNLPGPSDVRSSRRPQNNNVAQQRPMQQRPGPQQAAQQQMGPQQMTQPQGKVKPAALRTRVSDKPTRLRFADEELEEVEIQHAGLLPEDRGFSGPMRR